jgi:hypothetical protein
MKTLRADIGRFCADRAGGPAIEFAICGTALAAFLIAVLNLALLGLVLGALEHGVQMAGRWDAIQASASYASSTNTVTAPCLGRVVTAFNAYASPPLPSIAQPSGSSATGTASSNPLSIKVTWYPGGAGGSPGAYLTLLGTYNWSPFGFANFPAISLPLKITTAMTVLGSSQSGVTVSAACS